MEWNSLPHSLRDPSRSTDGFKPALKTHRFAAKGTFSALEPRRDALHKSPNYYYYYYYYYLLEVTLMLT